MITLNELMSIEKSTQKRKTVKRSYKTKTGVKTKTYTYGESVLLFRKTKTGYKVIEKNWNEFEKTVNKSLPASKAVSVINEARRIRNDIMNNNEIAKYDTAHKIYFGGNLDKKGKYQAEWNRIDIHSMISRIAANSVYKYLINMGITPEEIVQYVYEQTNEEVPVEEILNEGNWKQDTVVVKTKSGKKLTLQIKFSYDGVSNIKIL